MHLALPLGNLLRGWLHQVGCEAGIALARLRLVPLAISCFVVSAPIACVLSMMSAFLARFALPKPTTLAEGMIWAWALACVLACWFRLAVVPLAAGSLRSIRRRQRLETLLLVRQGRRDRLVAATVPRWPAKKTQTEQDEQPVAFGVAG